MAMPRQHRVGARGPGGRNASSTSTSNLAVPEWCLPAHHPCASFRRAGLELAWRRPRRSLPALSQHCLLAGDHSQRLPKRVQPIVPPTGGSVHRDTWLLRSTQRRPLVFLRSSQKLTPTAQSCTTGFPPDVGAGRVDPPKNDSPGAMRPIRRDLTTARSSVGLD
jgi:hypothetical protein